MLFRSSLHCFLHFFPPLLPPLLPSLPSIASCTSSQSSLVLLPFILRTQTLLKLVRNEVRVSIEWQSCVRQKVRVNLEFLGNGKKKTGREREEREKKDKREKRGRGKMKGGEMRENDFSVPRHDQINLLLRSLSFSSFSSFLNSRRK